MNSSGESNSQKCIFSSIRSIPRTPLRKTITPLKRVKSSTSPVRRKNSSPSLPVSPVDNSTMECVEQENTDNNSTPPSSLIGTGDESRIKSASKLKSCLARPSDSRSVNQRSTLSSLSTTNVKKTHKRVSFSASVVSDSPQSNEFMLDGDVDSILYNDELENAIAKLRATESLLNKETQELLGSTIYSYFG